MLRIKNHVSSKCLSAIFLQIRQVFKESGEWKPALTIEVKKELEKYWIPRLQRAPRRAGSRGKYYVLSMFPYPSGKLHMGHVRVYAISDAMARYRSLQGYHVIHPMGWDAFGLPAENAAAEHGVSAEMWTRDNIDKMKNQLINLGFAFDWEREISTCDPSYYKWTQFLFLKLWENGLAYQKEAFVNWDPVDQTVLANEQVDEHGNSWRSGAKVEKKLLKQWFIRTSAYARKLRESLDTLENWDEVVKLQKFWIGDICGHWVTMDLIDKHTGDLIDQVRVFAKNKFDILTSTFVALAPQHEIFAKIQLGPDGSVSDVLCRNPITGDVLPLFSEPNIKRFQPDCDAFLGSPVGNEKETEFLKERGVSTKHLTQQRLNLVQEARESASGVLHDVLEQALRSAVVSEPSSPKLKDWLISRQRYWGTPIPIVKCPTCGPVPVPYENLPVELPPVTDVASKSGTSLRNMKEWLETKCPKCDGPAQRETDTMDTFVDSSWYFLRYLDSKNENEPFYREAAFSGMPVDLYIGGKEHALMHLFYARFIGHFLHDLGQLPEPEPFRSLLTQGYVQGRAFMEKATGRYLRPDEVKTVDRKLTSKSTGNDVVEVWTKMSKSKYNGFDPDFAAWQYGVDSTRLFMLGNISPRSHRRWDPDLFRGLLNWEHNLWAIVADYLKTVREPAPELSDTELKDRERFLFDSRNYYLKGLNFALDKHFSINVAISKLQGITASLKKMPLGMSHTSEEYRRTLQQILVMTFPFSPHYAAELWSAVRSVPNSKDIADREIWEMSWPELDYEYPLDLVVKVGGEEIDALKVPRSVFDNLTKEEAIKMALESAKFQHYSKGTQPAGGEFSHFPLYEAVIDLKCPDALKRILQEKKLRKQAKATKS